MANTEVIATGTIDLRFARCGRVKAFIANNDKTPLFDGFINVHERDGYRKEDLLGHVSVQVKGRSKSVKGDEATYDIPRTDLDVYRRYGGVLYLVVFIDADRAAPYYVNLSPFVIEKLLSSNSKAKELVRVKMRELPTDPSALEAIVGVALATKKQLDAPFKGEGFGRITDLTVRSARPIDLTAPVTISSEEGDVALEAKTVDGSIVALPGVLSILPPSYEGQQVDLEVSAGNVTFSSVFVRQLGPEVHEIRVSDHLVLQFDVAPENRRCSVTLTLASSLAERAKDLDFYLAVVDTRSMSFQGDEYELQLSGFSGIDELRRHRQFLGELLELFATLHVDPEMVLLDDISKETLRQLGHIHQSLVRGEMLHGRASHAGLILVELGPWKLLLILKRANEPDSWSYVNPFDLVRGDAFLQERTDESSKHLRRPVTVFEAVPEEHLPTILNLRLDTITDAYERLGDGEEARALANFEVLALVTAADTVPARRAEFLTAANVLNEWLIQEAGPSDVHLVNRWQILHRTTGIDVALDRAIRAARRRVITTSPENAGQLEASFAILLGNPADVDDCVERLSPEERKAMEGWPIWALKPAAAALSEVALE